MSDWVLVVNCGSSSVKFALVDPKSGEESFNGIAERLGQAGQAGEITYKYRGEKETHGLSEGTHQQALTDIVAKLRTLGLFGQVVAVGHRIVHGGEYFSQSVRVQGDVRDKIADCIRLAPLHNPAHVIGIDAAQAAFPDLPQVAVFDTAFHQHMPERAYLYALPYALYRDHGIRRYGFHGTSYRYVAARMHTLLGNDGLKLVIAHLGNGGSVAAVLGDHSVDTTMGLTPLEGIVHGTRCGDIDPAIPRILTDQFSIDVHEVGDILWKQSGLLGLSELSNDCRTLEDALATGNAAAQRAMDVYNYRLAKHIAGQMVALGGVDALVFTGGIGENSSYVRAEVVKLLGFMGFALDKANNEAMIRGAEGNIAAAGSTAIWVVPTNEELLIARDTLALITEG